MRNVNVNMGLLVQVSRNQMRNSSSWKKLDGMHMDQMVDGWT